MRALRWQQLTGHRSLAGKFFEKMEKEEMKEASEVECFDSLQPDLVGSRKLARQDRRDNNWRRD